MKNPDEDFFTQFIMSMMILYGLFQFCRFYRSGWI
jgi:hypothetical protein